VIIFYLHLVRLSEVAEMGDRLATIDTGRKEGRGCCAPFRGGTGSPSKNVAWTEAYLCSPYQVASWSIQPFGHNSHGPKIEGGGAVPVSWGRGSWIPN